MSQSKKDYWQRYYQAKRKELLEQKRQHYWLNRETILAKKLQYRQANLEKLRERNRQYRQDNREILNDKKRLNRVYLKAKFADGSILILRQYEKRECKDYEDCLEKAALVDLRHVPCHQCSITEKGEIQCPVLST